MEPLSILVPLLRAASPDCAQQAATVRAAPACEGRFSLFAMVERNSRAKNAPNEAHIRAKVAREAQTHPCGVTARTLD